MRRVLVLLAIVAQLGCGKDKKKEVFPLEQVPESVMKIAKEKLPDVKFERAFKEPNGDYELIGKGKNGKVREIDISPSGQVNQIE